MKLESATSLTFCRNAKTSAENARSSRLWSRATGTSSLLPHRTILKWLDWASNFVGEKRSGSFAGTSCRILNCAVSVVIGCRSSLSVLRRYINDMKRAKTLQKNILTTLRDKAYVRHGITGAAPLPACRVQKFARYARTMRRIFSQFDDAQHAARSVEDWKKGKAYAIAKDKNGEETKVPIPLLPPGSGEPTLAGFVNMIYKTRKTHANIIDIAFTAVVDDNSKKKTKTTKK